MRALVSRQPDGLALFPPSDCLRVLICLQLELEHARLQLEAEQRELEAQLDRERCVPRSVDEQLPGAGPCS